MLRGAGLVKVAVVAMVLGGAVLPVAAQDELHAQIEGYLAKIRPYTLYGNEGASNALLALAPQMHTARPELIAALAEKHMVVRWSVARVLGTIGPEAREAVPALAAALPTSEWYAQVMIAWALGRMGPAAREAVPALADVLAKSKDVWVKREVAVALGAIGPEARAALPPLTAALQDANGFVRVAAATALYQVAQDASGLPLLIAALQDPYVVGARVAADALAEWGPGAKSAVPALVATLKDPAPCAQVAAARALWLIDGSTQGTPQLVAALRDEEPEVRQRAAATLKLIADATGQTFPAPPTAPLPARPLVFNAEDWSGPAEAIVKDRWVADKWNLWTQGAPEWSRGAVLAAPSVTKDRDRPEDGAPVLHTHITGLPAGLYEVTVQHSRALGVSLDAGQTWRKLEGQESLGNVTIKDGTFDLWVDDRYADSGKPGPHYYNTVTFTAAVAAPPKPVFAPVRGWATQRVRERLDRALTAIRTKEGVYLSWRLLAEDPKNIAFNVYRADGTAPARKLNDKPLTATTDFLDRTAPAGGGSRYGVAPVGNPKGPAPASVTAPATDLPYLPIKLQGNYRALSVGVGDLDGDGRSDYVIKQPETEIWGFMYTWYRSPDTYKLEAYNADGKFMWRQSMGWGIEMGIWFAPYVVHDLDGDGRAEVIAKGTDADPRDAEGMCNQGREYVTVLDGRTGKLRARAEFPSRDNFGNSGKPGDVAARNQLAIAYLDGKTPCVIAERGTYGLQKVMAYQLNKGKLEILWRWDNATGDRRFYGQGAHTLHAADVDGDSRDEVILGSSVLDDTGAPLWSTGMGHPDVCCVGDFVPTNPGLEIFYTLENPQKQNGTCVVDARTGKVLWGHPQETFHVGSGQVSDIDPAQPGCEAWAAEDPKSGAFGNGPPPRWLYSASGEKLAEGPAVPAATTVVYWDGDVQRELLRGGQPMDWQGGTYPPAIQGTTLAVADVTGDWREEIITALPGELRIYTTTVPAADRRVCLLQDPTYRTALADISSGYYSQPMLGYLPTSDRSSALLSGPPDGLAARQENPCAVLVVAGSRAPLSGTLRLAGGPDVSVTPAEFPVSLAAGQSLRLPFTVRLTQPPSPLAGRVAIALTATLRPPTGEALQAQASLPVRSEPLAGIPLTNAGDFVEQVGGEGRLRTDKPDSAGRAFSHWNYKGHRVSWEITVPQAGRYHLVFRYANSFGAVAERSLLVDGKPLPGAERVAFPPVGTVLDEWATLAVRRADGSLAVWELTAGAHRLDMENTNDRWLNLDQLAFVPAGQ